MTQQADNLVVAIAQAALGWADVRANLRETSGICRRAAGGGAKLIVFPAGALTGSPGGLDEPSDPAEYAVRVPGPEIEMLHVLCGYCGLSMIMGTEEREPRGAVYATAVVITPDGYLGKMRQVHLAPRDDVHEPGGETPVFEIGGWRFGVGVDRDLRFPELARVAAVKGADAYVVPSTGAGLPAHEIDDPHLKSLANHAMFGQIAPARAIDNTLYVLVAASTDLGGGSVAFDPLGGQIAYGRGDQDLVFVTLSREVLAAARATEYHTLPGRRPAVYGEIIQPPRATSEPRHGGGASGRQGLERTSDDDDV